MRERPQLFKAPQRIELSGKMRRELLEVGDILFGLPRTAGRVEPAPELPHGIAESNIVAARNLRRQRSSRPVPPPKLRKIAQQLFGIGWTILGCDRDGVVARVDQGDP